MIASGTSDTISIDVSSLGRMEHRERVWRWMRDYGYTYTDLTDFWSRFRRSVERPDLPPRVLLIGDLANVVRHYREWQPREWTTAVRKARPYFLLFVRTRRDEQSAFLIDDLMRHSDLRVTVCRNLDQKNEVLRCLADALTALEPESLAEVRYSVGRDALWVAFADGLSGFVSWEELGIEDLRRDLVPESAGIGDHGRILEVARREGEVLDIDALSVRSVIDLELRDALKDQGAKADQAVGARIRAVRERRSLTQTELGLRSGLDQAVVSRLERGKHQPRFDTLRRIAEALDLRVPELLRG